MPMGSSNPEGVLCAMSEVVTLWVGVVLETCRGQPGGLKPDPTRGPLLPPMTLTSSKGPWNCPLGDADIMGARKGPLLGAGLYPPGSPLHVVALHKLIHF